MKPNTVVNTVEGSLGGTSVAMQIDANSIAHIMSVLTELYSDPALAVVREYSVNARDSHVEAGQTRPIEVTTPSPLSKYFKVKDYGVGLSVDELTDMYSKYGASTKRGTDTQTGMLGLGSKSGLAYTNQFTIVSVKNGVKATVVVRRVEDGTGVLEIIDTMATDEPNGVEIVIPARNTGDFEDRCADFFKYWEPGTVLVNGAQPKSITDKGNQILPHIWISPSNYYGEGDTVVMGGVPYPMGTGRINYRYSVTAFLPIGSVNFTPSREELHFTDLTNKAIAGVKAELEEAIKAVGQEKVVNAPTKWEAAKAYREFVHQYGVTILPEYQGVKLTESFDERNIRFELDAPRHSTSIEAKSYPPSNVPAGHGVIHNFPYTVLSSDRKAKIRKYVEDNDLDIDSVSIFTYRSQVSEWVIPDNILDWNEVAKTDLGKTYAAKGGKVIAPYSVAQKGGGYKDETGLTGDILYFSPADAKADGSRWYNYADYFPDYTIVCINKNRWDKFLRDYPNAQPIKTMLRADVAKAQNALTAQDKMTRNANSAHRKLVEIFKGKDVKDPDIKALLTLDPDSATLKAWDAMAKRYQTIFGYTPNFPSSTSQTDVSKIQRRYPLLNLDSYYKANAAHALIYVNAIYDTENNS